MLNTNNTRKLSIQPDHGSANRHKARSIAADQLDIPLGGLTHIDATIADITIGLRVEYNRSIDIGTLHLHKTFQVADGLIHLCLSYLLVLHCSLQLVHWCKAN